MLWNGQNLITIENLGLALKINSAMSDRKSNSFEEKNKIADACV